MKAESSHKENLPPEHLIELEIRVTIFGSTMAKVVSALKDAPVGTVLSVRTNDP